MKSPFGIRSWGYGQNVNRTVKEVPLAPAGCNEETLTETKKSKAKTEPTKDPALHFTIQRYGSQGHQHGSGSKK